MASLALGALGAGIGSMFGYASIGWSIGSFIGGQLSNEGQDIKGPRLTDRSVSGSTYGNIRPVIYGSYRVGGEIIWAADLKEHKHKEEAGKGGSGGSYTSYTYTSSFAMALCEGPIIGIRKMWFDGKLVFSEANDANAAELQVSDKLAKRIRVYTGSETQTADPVMEAYLGSGNVPAYRGTAYITFDDLEVSDYGNRIPQITVEVVTSGSYTLNGTNISSGGESARQSLSLEKGVARSFFWEYTYAGGDTDRLFEQRTYSLVDGSLITSERAFASGTEDSFGWRYLYALSMSPNAKFCIAEGGDIGTGNNKRYYLMAITGGLIMPVDVLPMKNDMDNYENGNGREYNIIWEDDYSIWFYKFNSGDVYHYKIVTSMLGTIFISYDTFNVDSTRESTDPNGGIGTFAIDRATGDLYVEVITNEVTPQHSIKRYSSDGELLETKFVGISFGKSFRNRLMAYCNGYLFEVNNNSLEMYEWETEELIASYASLATNATYITGAIMEASGSLVSILASGVVYNYYRVLTQGVIGLDDVVASICDKVGIDASDIDVTDLASQDVRGFMIGNQSAARGALEQLSAAYFFDGRESDGVMEFVLRGDDPVLSLSDDDLGCYEGDNVVELMDTERQQEEELPKALTLNYANIGADYQIGAQHSLRQSVLEGTETTIQLPIVFNDSEAKAIVDKMMFVAWQNRHRFTLNTWQKYHKIDPADVISARGETMRVVARTEGVNGIIELSCVRELPNIYTGQVGTGAQSGHTSQTVTVYGPTQLRILDIPPLRDDDYDTYGIYAAASGYLPDWNGGAVFKSSDGTNYEYVMTLNNASVIGQSSTALGDFYGGNVFDELNIVRVSVNGTLESKTRAEVLNGANVAMLGDEMIQFRTATLVSSGVYDLTGLLRGRMGTDWAMSTHETYDSFVLLSDSTTRFVDLATVDYNNLRTWGAVSVGDTLEDIITGQYTYTAQNQKPLSPVHLGGGTAGPGSNWTINWKRRSRYRWQWVDSVDVGSDEDSNDFEIAILSGGSTVRTISVTGATTGTYTLAQQVADFGYWQPSISVKVRQVGGLKNSEWTDDTTLTSTRNSLMLLHFNGSNASTTFTDEYGTPITANGNAKVSTGQSKFGGASGLFDGTGDYLSFTRTLNLSKSTGFTIDCWVYITGNTTADGNGNRTAAIYTLGSGSNFMSFMIDGDGTTTGTGLYIEGRTSGTLYGVAVTVSISQSAWHHVEVDVSSSATRFFMDGTLYSAAAIGQSIAVSAENYIGKSLTTTYERGFLGYIDELRITPRVEHTASFTAPTSAYTE